MCRQSLRSNYYGFSLLVHYAIDLMIHFYFAYRLRKFNTSFTDNKYIVGLFSCSECTLRRISLP